MVERHPDLLERGIIRPIRLIGEGPAWSPARQHVPGDMVVEIDKAWNDDTVWVDDKGVRDVRLLVGYGGDAPVRDADVSVLDHAVRGHHGATEDQRASGNQGAWPVGGFQVGVKRNRLAPIGARESNQGEG